MNCQQIRRHWDLYYDSEGDAELHFQLNEHLEKCPECAEWFDKQSRLESLLEDQLREVPSNQDACVVDWSSVLVGAGVMPVAKSRSWLFLGTSLLALAASLLILFGIYGRQFGIEGGRSLSQLSADVHQHISSGGLRPEFESQSDLEVDQYLLKRVSFPVRCPPRKDSGFEVSGAGLCQLSDQPAAYVVGSVDQQPVSIFVLPKASLDVFRQQRDELRHQAMASCREGNTDLVMSVVDKNLVLVAGDVAPSKLARVLRSYGTYPHD